MTKLVITLDEKQINQERIFINKNDRDSFPAVGAEFTIKTNIPGASLINFTEAKLMYPHDEYHIHLSKTKWFTAYKLKPEDKLIFEIDPENGEYKLIQILRKSPSPFPSPYPQAERGTQGVRSDDEK